MSILEKLEELRAFLHTSIITKTKTWADSKNQGAWSMLWTSFDNIHDTQQAIERFKVGDTGILGVYGLLQAMSVQQDAVMHIEQALDLKHTPLTDMPVLKELRRVRDEAVGHPTKTTKAGKSSRFDTGTITYTSMWTASRENFKNGKLSYYIWSNDGADLKEVDLKQAIKDQELQLSKRLEKVRYQLIQEEKKHMQKFKNQKLVDIFSQTDYLFSKLYSFEVSREYSRSCCNQLSDQYVAFKRGIIERYGQTALTDPMAIPGIYETCQKLDQLLDRVRARIMLENGQDRLELDVYIESAEASFKELITMASEVDERFTSK